MADHKENEKDRQKDDAEVAALTEAEWKKRLGDQAFHVLREAGTEAPFSGAYNMHFEDGVYHCAGCHTALFDAGHKFKSHCGWPSFDGELPGDRIVKRRDTSHGMIRTEICCAKCGGHLGHLFDDGPTQSGLRYCVNSVSLEFEKRGRDA